MFQLVGFDSHRLALRLWHPLALPPPSASQRPVIPKPAPPWRCRDEQLKAKDGSHNRSPIIVAEAVKNSSEFVKYPGPVRIP